MTPLLRLVGWIADLKLAIGLLVVIAAASAVGTLIPQQESASFYHKLYDPQPWLGLLPGDAVLGLELDHVYSSRWFLALLAWLALSLVLCSWRRQWPALQAALRWVDYRTPRQLSKLTVAETLSCTDALADLERLDSRLRQRGWQVRRLDERLAARRGVLGRVGPLLVHAGMVVLMLGAAWGALGGQRAEQFLAPGRSLELVDRRGHTTLTLALDQFAITRDPAGRPEQFSSSLRLLRGNGQVDQEADHPDQGRDGADPNLLKAATISVNHPLRFQGITLYQADWSLAAVSLRLGNSPVLEVPLQSFPQLGDQIWGLVLPTRPDGSDPVLLSVTSEQGPVAVFGADGARLGQIAIGGEPLEVNGVPMRVSGILPASGILLKRDPGVPLVYSGFALTLLGGGLSVLATRQLWAIAEGGRLHVGGLCNRNLTAFAQELPNLLGDLDPAQTDAPMGEAA
ncbi:C-type cytochrome biogenesis protein [Cyanobium sp. PCC 7001]|uniref:cytochrome c biogenesis protein ResB n=1 Tax=Cyanobium sp. PCC 7001 TaxID=180281 RepID=UPI0001805AF5|nr:cytochrome c biogenesis protein ResB [Cyanobium sp. PCC 7001]EDY37191.1 C-type cytochrome biogenesis protein [Cyanobium sp. PCC 7001]